MPDTRRAGRHRLLASDMLAARNLIPASEERRQHGEKRSSRPLALSAEHDHAGADLHALVEVNHVLVAHPDAVLGYYCYFAIERLSVGGGVVGSL